MSEISIHQFDTARAITDTLEIDGDPINLAGAAVKIRFYDIQRQTMWEQDADVGGDGTAGEVSYDPADEDVADAGAFEFEWGVVFANGKPMTVPTEERNKLTIWPAIVPTP